jgi:AraC-like DNA-binding protein
MRLRTIQVKDPTWATASGLHIGRLYREFYDALLDAPLPPELTDEQREIYFEELRNHDKLRLLLDKAMSVYEKTLLMAERVGARNDWVDRARDEIRNVRRVLRGEPAGDSPAGDPHGPAQKPPPRSFVL